MPDRLLTPAKEIFERCILHGLSAGSSVFGVYDTYYHLGTLAYPPYITIEMARALCRDLTDRGMAEYRRGLWDEDGIPAGAGYGITPRGLRYRCALDEIYGGDDA